MIWLGLIWVTGMDRHLRLIVFSSLTRPDCLGDLVGGVRPWFPICAPCDPRLHLKRNRSRNTATREDGETRWELTYHGFFSHFLGSIFVYHPSQSKDWFKGKSTGIQEFMASTPENDGFPVDGSLISSILCHRPGTFSLMSEKNSCWATRTSTLKTVLPLASKASGSVLVS